MIAKRLSSLAIETRELMTIIYGNTNDIFIGSDLRTYGFYEGLYLYLKAQQYDSVIFHDQLDYFHSYGENDLAAYLNGTVPTSQSESVPKQQSLPFPTPFNGGVRRRTVAPPREPLNPDAKSWELTGNSRVYRLLGKGQEFSYLIRALESTTLKTAIIFRIASANNQTERSKTFFEDTSWKTLLSKVAEDYSSKRYKSKVIFTFGKIHDESTLIPVIPYDLRDFFVKSQNQTQSLIPENKYFVPFPESDEVGSLLQRKRLMEELELYKPAIPLEKLQISLLQKRLALNALNNLDIKNHMESMNTESAWDKLRQMKGIEPIIEQLELIIDQLKSNKQNQNKAKIRPHLCFKGSPGTGKTTVAKLVAEIFREEGILTTGHLVEASAKDLVAGYVGQTSGKTEELFEKARGGILFIDEAYGLLNKNKQGGPNFEDQAIQVMIQKMEEESWRQSSLVILAGYTDQIDELLKEGNPGFSRRFSAQNHIVFKDYEPSVLVDMLLANLSNFGFIFYEEGVKDALAQIVKKLHSMRGHTWGNAGEMENLASEIHLHYLKSKANDCTVRMQHIPPDKRKYISPTSNSLTQLNNLIGLANVKSEIRKIYNQLTVDKLRDERKPGNARKYQMNFVFRGNSGTGKTTVARIIGNMLSELGMLGDDKCIEVGRSNLVGQYLGQTAIKVGETFKNALGNTLFIDEVYSLVTGSQDSYGLEAVNEIVRLMTLPQYEGTMALIIAGYPEDVNKFLSLNDGLSRRFNFYIDFDDYSNEELLKILKLKLDNLGLTLHPDAEAPAITYFDQFSRGKGFINAGLADKLIKIAKASLDGRIMDLRARNESIDDQLNTILPVDIPHQEHRFSPSPQQSWL